MRNLKIFRDQFNQLPLMDFITLLKHALFFDEPILIYEKEVTQTAGQVEDIFEGVKIKKGDLDDLEQAKQMLNPLPWEFQCHVFDGVTDFFVARDAVGVQHISWVYSHRHRNRFLALGKGEVEIKFCLTLPALRGRGIYPRVLLEVLDYLHSTGVKRAFMCVHRDNVSSIRGVEKAGFTRIGEIRLKKFLGIQISPRYETDRRIS